MKLCVWFFSLILGLLLSASASAQGSSMYVCKEENGVLVYQNSPGGRNCKKLNLEPVVTVPSGRPRAVYNGEAASSGQDLAGYVADYSRRSGSSVYNPPAPSNDPMQKGRDADRKRIIEEELRQEEFRLTDLKKELLSGRSPEKSPRIRDEIARSESTIDTLKRELSKIRE